MILSENTLMCTRSGSQQQYDKNQISDFKFCCFIIKLNFRWGWRVQRTQGCVRPSVYMSFQEQTFFYMWLICRICYIWNRWRQLQVVNIKLMTGVDVCSWLYFCFLHLTIYILCYFIQIIHYISGKDIVLFTALHFFEIYGYECLCNSSWWCSSNNVQVLLYTLSKKLYLKD